MAKHRRRFYVAGINGGGYEILSLKYKPTEDVYTYSHKFVDGPFRTFNDAVKALENRAGCNPERSNVLRMVNRAIADLQRVGFTPSEAKRIAAVYR